jgi:hypothetical protein
MHSRQPASSRAHASVSRRALASARGGVALLTALLLAAAAPRARGQQVDSARVSPKPPKVDTVVAPVPRPPLSPRRAFLSSLVLPGYAQAVLGRPTAGALFVLSEAIAIAMLRESNAELRQARRLLNDSLLTLGRDPVTGTIVTVQAPYNQELVNLRRGHREDWVAFLIANHIFAGADAYVAAHLWDLPSQVSLRATDQGAVVSARLRW